MVMTTLVRNYVDDAHTIMEGESHGEFRPRCGDHRLGVRGSVAALRAVEKGYRVGVMEAGRRWKDEDIPKTNWDLKHYV
jgi:hypothetical protein